MNCDVQDRAYDVSSRLCVSVLMILCLYCVFIELQSIAQSGSVVLLIVILFHSHWSSHGRMRVCVCVSSLVRRVSFALLEALDVFCTRRQAGMAKPSCCTQVVAGALSWCPRDAVTSWPRMLTC